MKIYLSAIIITKNEEENIARCLESLSFVDEIVVVDSGSTDGTLEIAKKYKANIFKRKFDDFSSQRNFAISKAQGNWILSLDADEEISEELALEIKNAIESEVYNGYLIPRKNIIFGKEIKHTRWSPDKHIWLFKKGKGKFANLLHEEVEVEGKVGELSNAKIHHSHKNVSQFLEMTNAYTEYESESNQRSFSFIALFFFPLRSFFGRYIIKQGFRDGWRGFVLSYLRAIYQFLTYAKQWEKSSH